MLSSSSPLKIPLPFAANAGAPYIRPIPLASQIGVQDGAASFTDGFVPDNFTQIAAGGVPPFGQDMNGLMNQITAGLQWIQAGGPVFFDQTFANEIGGYPKGALLDTTIFFPGLRWLSIIENNLNDPDTVGTGWVQAPGQVQVGTPMPSLSTVAPYGYITANGKTIGNAASNANGLASSVTYPLFFFIWSNLSNGLCPLFNSAGTPISRGANPLADFSANNQLQLPYMVGQGLMGADTMGGITTNFLTGVPVVVGSRTAPGSTLGENFHTLTTAELAAHVHTNFLSDPGHTHTIGGGGLQQALGNQSAQNGGGFTSSNNNGLNVIPANTTGASVVNASAGSNTPHNTVERNMIVYWSLKL